MNGDEKEIRDVIDRWHRATPAGDLDTILTLMADDALFLRGGQRPMTKADFAKNFRALPGDIQSKHDIKEIYVSGDLAFCHSHITVTMGGKRREGPILTVFRKIGGKWLLSRDANMVA